LIISSATAWLQLAKPIGGEKNRKPLAGDGVAWRPKGGDEQAAEQTDSRKHTEK
jgi:hypothetical protein